MKKLLALGALVGVCASFSAFAEEEIDLSDLVPADQIEMTLSEDCVDDTNNSGDSFEIDDHYPGRPGFPGYNPGRPGHHPGHPGYNPGHPGYDRERVTCFARNGRGQTFSAMGRNSWQVQRRAMEKCYQYSHRCFELGCRSR